MGVMSRLLPLLLVLCVLASACGQAFGDPAVAAIVNGERIEIADLRPLVTDAAGAVDPATGQAQDEQAVTVQTLSELSLLTLLSQELQRLGGERVDDAELGTLVDDAMAQAGGEEAFTAGLEAQGITMNRVRLDLSFQTTIDRLIEQLGEDFEVSEEEIQFRYNSAYGLPTVFHILVATEEEANAVLDRLAAGENFAALAEELSIDPGSAANGGSLGPLQIGAFVPEFEAAALATEPGTTSPPVETQFGFHIITTEPPEELTPELRTQIVQELTDQGVQQELGALLTRLLDAATVSINPRFGRWDPQFGVNGGLAQLVAPTDPLGDLQPAGALDGALGLDPAAGQAPGGQAPAAPAGQ